jgi:hypothetical protein
MIFMNSGFNDSRENAGVKTLSIQPALFTVLKHSRKDWRLLFTIQALTPLFNKGFFMASISF